MLFELLIHVQRIVMLPHPVSQSGMHVRVNAVVELFDSDGKVQPRRQETESGTWDTGTRCREVFWASSKRRKDISQHENSSGVLKWTLSDHELRLLYLL